MTRILLLEESPTRALSRQHLMQQEGWEVTVALNPEQALDLLKVEIPDLLIADYYQPGMKSYDLTQLIRSGTQAQNLPILLLTVAESGTAVLADSKNEANYFLERSADDESLCAKVRTLLSPNNEPQSDSLAKGEATILIVEDSPTFQAFLLHELGSEGYQVQAAASGEEALKLCELMDFDAILVDLILPGIQGLELCRMLETRRVSQEASFAIIILTSREDSEDMTKGLEAGADDFLSKSSDLTVVKARLRGLVRRKRFQDENARISKELKERELETLAARTEARAREEFATKLERVNKELEAANRELGDKQSQLVQSEKMASLGQLVAGIAHEINNPLAFVMTNLHNVRGWISGMSPEVEPHLSEAWQKKWTKTGKRLEDAEAGLERVRDLVLRLRTFSRLDEGEFKVVDIHESLDSVLMLLEHRLKNSPIRMECQYDFPHKTLGCFPGQFNQVVMNLITNAIDGIGETGNILLKTFKKDNDFVLLVRDDGVGIPKAIQNRVFDPFFTTKPVGLGTGLGMSISYGIIKAHKGQISLSSEPGEGAEFRVQIPLNLEQRLQGGTND